MSTPHVVDDEIVEALAKMFCARRSVQHLHGGPYPCEACEIAARDFIAQHRLVRLPEEADGWQSEIRHEVHGVGWLHEPDEECARRTATDIGGSTGRIRPVYRIPGQPIEVSKEGGEG